MSRQSKNVKNRAKAKEVTLKHASGQPAGRITTKGKGKNAAKRLLRATQPAQRRK